MIDKEKLFSDVTKRVVGFVDERGSASISEIYEGINISDVSSSEKRSLLREAVAALDAAEKIDCIGRLCYARGKK